VPRGSPETSVSISVQKLQAPTCSQAFVARDLPHITQGRTQPATGYDGNGSGVALGDLNNDGLIDIVLANLVGPSTILWNQGNFRFRKTTLAETATRAVAIVDVNSDGWSDITFTHNVGAPGYWRNQKGSGFVADELPGVRYRAFTLLWDDLEGGRLDLITASYDAILEAELRDSFLFSDGAGVILYQPGANGYTPKRLARQAQALALATFDVNNDGKRDLMVGNDFDFPDMVWQNSTWNTLQPFPRFSKHTMGFSLGDINNDGKPELFSTDMKPDFRDLKALAAWIPLMEPGYKRAVRSARQKPENMLQMRSSKGFKNMAYGLGLDATGWSWSAKFGDLDNDGFEDLYVVNGMIDKELLGYLPQGEMVEENQVFRNLGGEGFQRWPDWKLGSIRSGRGMSMADLNNDGTLDIVVNNFGSPAQLFENRVCGGKAIEVELRWEGSKNTRAIGAQVLLRTDQGRQWRQITSLSGYISGDASRVHFGMGQAETTTLEVIWPDNKRSMAQVRSGTLVTLTRKELQP